VQLSGVMGWGRYWLAMRMSTAICSTSWKTASLMRCPCSEGPEEPKAEMPVNLNLPKTGCARDSLIPGLK
jgi:hypothetical protein